jgi:hypothetical protein
VFLLLCRDRVPEALIGRTVQSLRGSDDVAAGFCRAVHGSIDQYAEGEWYRYACSRIADGTRPGSTLAATQQHGPNHASGLAEAVWRTLPPTMGATGSKFRRCMPVGRLARGVSSLDLTPLSGCDRGAGLFAFYRGRGVDRRFTGKFAAVESDRVLKERAAYR